MQFMVRANGLPLMNHRQLSALILVLLFVLSVVVRLPNLNRPISRHHESTLAITLRYQQIWHEEGGFRHKFCLISTYGNKADRNINNTGRLKDSEGNYYFVSFPPFAAIFSYFIFSVFNIYPDVIPQEVLNLLLHFVSCFLIFQIISLLTKEYYINKLNTPALIGFTVYLFSPATLWFHSNTCVADTLALPLFLIGIYIFLRFVLGENKRPIHCVLLGFISFFMVYTEWLGVFFCFSIFLYTLANIRKQEVRMLSYIITIALIASLALIIWQYSQVAGFNSLIQTDVKRYVTKSGFVRQGFNLRLEYLPRGVEFPQSLKDKIYYDADKGVLICKDVMSRKEKQQLLSLSSDDLYKRAVEEIFRQSQLFGANFACLGSWKNLALHYITGFLPFLVYLFVIAFVDFALFKRRLADMFYKNKTVLIVLYLCTVPVILHHLVFFNFTSVHDFSAIKGGVLIAILSALFYHAFTYNLQVCSDEAKPVREKIAKSIFCLMVAGSILQYLVINCYYLKGDDCYKKMGEEIARVAKKDEVVFIKAGVLPFVPPQIVHYAHRNIAMWEGDSKGKELLSLNKVKRGVIFVLNTENKGIVKTEYVNTQYVQGGYSNGVD